MILCKDFSAKCDYMQTTASFIEIYKMIIYKSFKHNSRLVLEVWHVMVRSVYNLDGLPLEWVEHYKYLGVYL